MSTTRDEFLARVRERVRDGLPENPVRPIVPLPDGQVPEIGYAIDLADLPGRFVTALEAVMGNARRVAGAGGVEAVLREVVEAETVQKATVAPEPECDGVADVLRSLGVDVVPHDDRDAVEQCDLGVTGAAYGIALTGSLVVDSRRAAGRVVSLLPRVHLAIVPESRLLPTPGDLFRDLPTLMPDGLPSNMVLITGPSRSADIELQITLGVHGPRSLWVGLLRD